MKPVDRYIYGDYTRDAAVYHGPRTPPEQPGRPEPVFDPERKRLWDLDSDSIRAKKFGGMIRCREMPGKTWATVRAVAVGLNLNTSRQMISESIRKSCGVGPSCLHFYRERMCVPRRPRRNQPIKNLATGEVYESIGAAVRAVTNNDPKLYHAARNRMARALAVKAGAKLAFDIPWALVTSLAPAARAEAAA